MKYVLDFKPDMLQILMEGEFTFSDTRTFRRLLSVMMEDHERKEVRLNMRQLEFVDSTALGLMMMAHDLAKKLHMTLVFEAPQGQVDRVLNEAARYNVLNFAA